MATLTTNSDEFSTKSDDKEENEEFDDLSDTIFDGNKICNNAEPLENALLVADPDDCGICGYVHSVTVYTFVFCFKCV